MTKTTKPELSPEAKRLFGKLQKEWNIRDEAGKFMLARAMECYDELTRAQEALHRDGEFIKDRWGQLKLHPATQRAKESRAHLLACVKALALDLESLKDESPDAEKA